MTLEAALSFTLGALTSFIYRDSLGDVFIEPAYGFNTDFHRLFRYLFTCAFDSRLLCSLSQFRALIYNPDFLPVNCV